MPTRYVGLRVEIAASPGATSNAVDRGKKPADVSHADSSDEAALASIHLRYKRRSPQFLLEKGPIFESQLADASVKRLSVAPQLRQDKVVSF